MACGLNELCTVFSVTAGKYVGRAHTAPFFSLTCHLCQRVKVIDIEMFCGSSVSSRFETKESVQANFGGPEDYVKAVEFSRGGDHIVSGGTDGVVRVFKYPSLKPVAQLPGSKAEINSVAFNSKGDLVRPSELSTSSF